MMGNLGKSKPGDISPRAYRSLAISPDLVGSPQPSDTRSHRTAPVLPPIPILVTSGAPRGAGRPAHIPRSPAPVPRRPAVPFQSCHAGIAFQVAEAPIARID